MPGSGCQNALFFIELHSIFEVQFVSEHFPIVWSLVGLGTFHSKPELALSPSSNPIYSKYCIRILLKIAAIVGHKRQYRNTDPECVKKISSTKYI